MLFVLICYRCRRIFHQLNLEDFSNVEVQILGTENMFGPHARSQVEILWSSLIELVFIMLWKREKQEDTAKENIETILWWLMKWHLVNGHFYAIEISNGKITVTFGLEARWNSVHH